jgi:hypothetical protein
VKAKRPVTLQISLAPADLPTARHTVPHQLRQWAGQVDEVLFTLDLHRSAGKFAEAWSDRLPGMRSLITGWCEEHPHARSVDVDYAPGVAAAVAQRFLGGAPVPTKDRRGAPFYAYLFALHAARHDVVLHMDSDMMFGGGSQEWVAEAVELLDTRSEVLACNPLPGPPTAGGELVSQQLAPYPYEPPAFQTTGFSTRIFILDRNRLGRTAGPLVPARAHGMEFIKAVVDGNPPYDTTENVVSAAMVRAGLVRVDFLGRGGGMWAVHPLYRSERFYARLPSLIDDIESGRVPDGQRGDHEINRSMVDWSGARPAWHRRAAGHVRLAASRLRVTGS